MLDTDRSRGLIAFKLGLTSNYIQSLRLLETQFNTVELLLETRLRELGAR